MSKPRLAITMGDPAGIGPEICAKALADPRVQRACQAIVFGDRATLGEGVEVEQVGEPLRGVRMGEATAECGAASHRYILAAIDAALAGRVDGVVTAPITKLSFHLAGIAAPGHTEIFAERTQAARCAMAMIAPDMAVALVTCHQPLRTAIDSISTHRIVEVAELLHETLTILRGVPPRLAVLGLNPHAGEGGMLGSEEQEIIAPAIAQLKERGIDAAGPIVPDAAFLPAALARFDGHVCMYHDQGLIPFKMRCSEVGVNLTMGLPFVRTSPDHGTAHDIAGRGIASASSMIEAILLAARLAAK